MCKWTDSTLASVVDRPGPAQNTLSSFSQRRTKLPLPSWHERSTNIHPSNRSSPLVRHRQATTRFLPSFLLLLLVSCTGDSGLLRRRRQEIDPTPSARSPNPPTNRRRARKIQIWPLTGKGENAKMGAWMSRVWFLMFPAREYKLVVVGLDNAGKTTTLYKLHLGEAVTAAPTIGSNVEEVVFKNLRFEVSSPRPAPSFSPSSLDSLRG